MIAGENDLISIVHMFAYIRRPEESQILSSDITREFLAHLAGSGGQ